MPRPIPVPVRQAIWRFQDGQDGPTIARALGLAPRTVRHLLDRFRRAIRPPWSPSYDPVWGGDAQARRTPRASRPRPAPRHPTWGAGLIRVMLRRQDPDRTPLPAVRTLATLVAPRRAVPGAARAAAHRRLPTGPAASRGLADGRRRAGEAADRPARLAGCGSSTSAAARCSGPRFSPRAVGLRSRRVQTQAQLRLAFARWGRPERLRVDNGTPWGTRGDLPTDLELWLLGLGVGVDRQPAAAAPGQRGGGAVAGDGQAVGRAAGPATAPEELQRRLEEMDEIQRQEYPSVEGRSRREAFPGWPTPGGATRRSGRGPIGAWRRWRRTWPATRCGGGGHKRPDLVV